MINGSVKMLKPGAIAPDVVVYDDLKKPVHIKDLYVQGKLVLFFYPRDFSPNCTKQACLFRDSYQDFINVGARVVGISSDDDQSHQSFRKKYRLPYELYSDMDGQAAKAFGIKKTLGILPGRITFVLDKEGVCQLVFSSQMQLQKHVEKALNVLKGL